MTESIIAKILSGIPAWPVHSHTPRKGTAMSNLSRRSLVTSAAALPALAVPGVASAAREAAPEAWVARLRPEFDRLLRLWLFLYALTNDDIWQHDGDLDLWAAFHGRINPVVDEIMDQKATTRDGLALQAQAFALDNSDCFYDHDDDDPVERSLGRARRGMSGFIESVCAFVGTLPPPLASLDADAVAAFKSDLEAHLTATPIGTHNRDRIVDVLLATAVQS
jgi:hypothetical protein